jgi:subtilisin family serine protease
LIAEAIATAIKSGILIFASASNAGANDPITFPARLQGVFCIGSADGLGAPSTFNPPSEGKEKYSALGEAVEAACPANLSQKPGYNASRRTIRRDGTSTSTPVAAAIAALLIEYIGQFTNVTEAQRYENVRKLFIDMSKATASKDYRYLAPWYLFEDRKDPKSYIMDVLSAPAGKITFCQRIVKELTVSSVR